MVVKPIVNHKTGKVEYRARYYWKDGEGKRRDSETGLFTTEKQALEEAVRLKKLKEAQARLDKDNKSNMIIDTVFGKWLEVLEERANRDTTENTTSDVALFQKARTIKSAYIPAKIRKTRIIDIDVLTFRQWLEYLNTCKQCGKGKGSNPNKELSGRSVRNFRHVLTQFNRYLGGQGYYLDNEMEIRIDNMLSRTKLKSINAGKKERYCPTIYDVRKILDHYEGNMIEEFEQLYWYTLFMVIFYSGMRPEEVIGLRWKHVHFDSERPYIDICNAISERERKPNVERRLESDIYHLKNNNSEREIPMLEYYYDAFESYRYRFKEYFKPSNMGNCFVFPNIKAKNEAERLTDYQKQKNILRELKRVCREVDIPDTCTVQMLRHACATWLVMDEEHGGMGYEESRARDYFGHTSDEMLRNVYAKLDKRQRANRTSETFSGITKKHAHARVPVEIQKSIEINEKIKNPDANEEDKQDSIYNRLLGEIMDAIRKGKKKYQYLIKDMFVIELIKEDYLEKGRDLTKEIDFVRKKTSMDKVWLADMIQEIDRKYPDEEESE